MPILLVAPRAAYAEDTISCSGNGTIFASEADGDFFRFTLTSPSTSSATIPAGTDIGNSWNTYGRVLGGPGGRVYGINSTGLWRYRWTGTAWETIDGNQRLQLNTSFTTYASAAYRNKITVDEAGDFFLIDNAGRLRQYRYDEPSRTWTIFARVIDTGWDRYDLIVAAGPGVLYARTPAGDLFRHRFEPVSQRWIARDLKVGSSWNGHSRGLFSVGGDTLFGIQADGDVYQYRYREDNNTWPVLARHIRSGFQIYPNVLATTNTCRLTATHTPARPATPIENFSPTTAMQSQPSGSIDYVYADNIGRLRHGRQESPDAFGNVQWTVISEGDAFTGRPALLANAQNNPQVFAHRTDSDVWSRTKAAPPSPDWQPPLALGGVMKSAPVPVRLSDNTLVVFALDADGALWFRPQNGVGGDLLPWRRLAGTAMAGTPVAVAGSDRSARLFALDGTGTPHLTTYRDGAIAAWTALGGSGFTGTPAVVVLPGGIVRLFVRSGAGQIVT
ncbi:MAG TPA: tachylectin-related carbohydrate-binding protein, partial [Micromonosporaceae bacterium]|nr:tachylectin-related carbohydrate-binding protein [Micromonosporaceae bacterium]